MSGECQIGGLYNKTLFPFPSLLKVFKENEKAKYFYFVFCIFRISFLNVNLNLYKDRFFFANLRIETIFLWC